MANELSKLQLVERIVTLLKHGTAGVKRNALLILGVLCAFGKSEKIVRCGALPVFLELTRYVHFFF